MRQEIEEKITNLFDENNIYVLFSGTSLNGNGPFRHLNDLFLILFLLIEKNIPSNKIYLAIDKRILDYLDRRTNNKKFTLLGKPFSYLEVINNYIDHENIIDVLEFEKTFDRGESDLVFFASGHGAMQGLAMDLDGTDDYQYISSDYFEKISDSSKRTVLIMSQCQAAAFHHLDTRKNICVLGSSDYQSSASFALRAMIPHKPKMVDEFSFEDNIPINPFIFSFFILIKEIDDAINNEKKNVINLFKFVASSTLSYLSESGKKKLTLTKSQLMALPYETYEIKFDNYILVQQPFLLNKILAARISVA